MKVEEYIEEWKTYTGDEAIAKLDNETRMALWYEWMSIKKDQAKADYYADRVAKVLTKGVEAGVKAVEASALVKIPGLQEELDKFKEQMDQL